MNIFEGGNVFKNAEGQPLTQRINQADVPATVKWLERLTGLDLSGPKIQSLDIPQDGWAALAKKTRQATWILLCCQLMHREHS